MALIKCTECSSEISDKAASCPKCGAPNRQRGPAPAAAPATAKSGLKTLHWVLILLVGGVAASNWLRSPESPKREQTAATPPRTAAAPPPAPAPAPRPIAVTAQQLYRAYHDNEVAADIQYKGKLLAVRGQVESIDKNFMNEPYLVIQAGGTFDRVHARFSKNSINTLAGLKKDQIIVMTCVGDGKVVLSPVIDCTETQGAIAAPSQAAAAAPEATAAANPMPTPAPAAPPAQATTTTASQGAVAAAPMPGWCKKPTNLAESMICANEQLWPLDLRVYQLYIAARDAATDKEPIKAQQLAWLKNRRNACDSVMCLEGAYKERIEDLSHPAGVDSSGMPSISKGGSYANLRIQMIQAGWQPYHAPGADECNDGDNRCKGRPEMQACSGTGVAACKFLWRKADQKIGICTVGEEDATVSGRC